MTVGADRGWMIGAGHMGQAMLKGWSVRGWHGAGPIVVAPSAPALPDGSRALADLPADGQRPAFVILAVKPQMFDAVARTLRPRLAGDTPVLSVMAGKRVAAIRAGLGVRSVVRAIPNLAVAINQGVIAMYVEPGDEPARRLGEAAMDPLGLVEWLPDEDRLDAATAIAGSGPAFVFRFVAAMARAAVELGLPPDQAERIALAVVGGAAASAGRSAASVDQLAAQVASKGGTTEAGLRVLDDGEALRRLVIEAAAAAYRRSRELG